MKVGLCGVGRWGRTLAHAFNRAGVEVAAHCRLTDGAMADRFGPRVEWKDMLGDKEVDAIVAATPPDVTTEIFLACQDAEVPCLLTKPLLLPPEWKTTDEVSSTTYVDYVHLFSPLWELVSSFIQDSATIKNMSATSTGQGPRRSFPQSLDYGPHALSLILDAAWTGTNTEIESSLISMQPDGGETLYGEVEVDGPRATFCAGQGQRVTTFHAELMHDEIMEVLYAEANGRAIVTVNGQKIVQDDAHNPLARLVQQFIWDVKTRDVNPRLVQMSVEISNILEHARKNALPKLPPQL